MMYFLLLAKPAPKDMDGSLTFWRANSAGYTCDIGQAGRYSPESAAAIVKGSAGEVIAVRLDIAERWSRKYIPASDYKYVVEAASKAVP